jgi:sec-independent protein translocase protein TatC
VVLPLSLKFLYSYTIEGVEARYRISEYLRFVLRLLFAFGLVFELPIVVLSLVKTGVVTPDTLAKGRKYALLLIFIGSAILTPPDVVTQVLIALPLILLFELSIWLGRLVKRKRNL